MGDDNLTSSQTTKVPSRYDHLIPVNCRRTGKEYSMHWGNEMNAREAGGQIKEEN